MSDNRAKDPTTLDQFLHMSPEEQAQRLYADQALWLGKYSGAGFVNPRREPIKIVDTEDRSVGEWRPSPEELIGTKDNSWK
jgi:hypothetical protein